MYEYETIMINAGWDNALKSLNTLAKAGWRLVQTLSEDENRYTVLILERPVQTYKEATKAMSAEQYRNFVTNHWDQTEK